MKLPLLSSSALLVLVHSTIYWTTVDSFVTPLAPLRSPGAATTSGGDDSRRFHLRLSTTNNVESPPTNNNDYNGVFVAKEGGRGATTASQQALAQGLSLGAPPARPSGGHYLTKGGLQVTAHVEPLEFSNELKSGTSASAVEELVVQLDDHKGVLLASSYEFPGRYARWSLGFVDPPLEISGRGTKCTIKALNQRGKVLMPAIEEAMKKLQKEGTVLEVLVSNNQNLVDGGKSSSGSGDALEATASRIDVTVVPPSEVGTFDEEQRSRQVSL